jgi:hypothetical protein
MDSREEDPIDFLARRAVNLCHVFETLSGLSQQLGNTSNSPFTTVVGAKMRIAILDLIRCTTAVGYIPEVIETTLYVSPYTQCVKYNQTLALDIHPTHSARSKRNVPVVMRQ